MRLSAFLVFTSAALVACAEPTSPIDPGASLAGAGAEASAQAHVDMEAVRAELLAADQASSDASASAGMLAGFVGTLADDVVYLHEFAPRVLGRTAVHDFLAGLPAYATATLVRTPARVDVSSDGTHGYTYGWTEIASAAAPVRYGTYIAYWRHDATDGWVIAAYVDVLTGAPPEAPPVGFESPTYRHYRFFPHSTASSAAAEVLEADRAFAALSAAEGPEIAFRAYAAPDAAAFGGFSQIVFGRDAIADGWTGSGAQLTWTPLISDAAESGDLGFSIGEATQIVGTRQGRQTYLSIWKRQRDGSWLFVADGGVPLPRVPLPRVTQ